MGVDSNVGTPIIAATSTADGALTCSLDFRIGGKDAGYLGFDEQHDAVDRFARFGATTNSTQLNLRNAQPEVVVLSRPQM